MAISGDTLWYIRTTGNELNGGGFDPTISGAGTNYADQATYQLALTDLAASGTTTLTSATGGFTAAMIGNCIRIAAGGGFSGGYYFVTGYTNTNTVTLDRSPGTGSNGVGRLGGPFNHLRNFFTIGGNMTNPLLTSPLVAGNTIYIRGSGSNDPAGVDYNWDEGFQKYSTGPVFDPFTNGWTKIIGVNGRPHLKWDHLFFHQSQGIWWENLKITCNTAGYGPSYGVTGSGSQNTHVNVIVDTNGQAAVGLYTQCAINCEIRNSGTKTASAGGQYGIHAVSYGATISGCVVKDQRGGGIFINANITVVENCIITRCGDVGLHLGVTTGSYGVIAANNTIHDNGSHGIYFSDSLAIAEGTVTGNIISNHTGVGKYGMIANFGSTAANDKLRRLIDNNNLYNNTANYSNLSAGPNDTYLDPQFTNAAGDDWSIGANLKAKGYPSTNVIYGTNTPTYRDYGPVQRQEPAPPNCGVLLGGNL